MATTNNKQNQEPATQIQDGGFINEGSENFNQRNVQDDDFEDPSKMKGYKTPDKPKEFEESPSEENETDTDELDNETGEPEVENDGVETEIEPEEDDDAEIPGDKPEED